MGVSDRIGWRWLATGVALGAMGAWAAVAAPGMAAGVAPPTAVEDRMAIEQLEMGDYPRALDGGHWQTYAAMWTDDGEFLYRGKTYKGPAEIAKVFDRPPRPAAPGAPPAVPTRTMHIVSNLSLKLDGDKATDQAYWQTLGVRDGRSVILGAGHYEDELRRVGGHWKFAKRAILYDVPATVPGATEAR